MRPRAFTRGPGLSDDAPGLHMRAHSQMKPRVSNEARGSFGMRPASDVFMHILDADIFMHISDVDVFISCVRYMVSFSLNQPKSALSNFIFRCYTDSLNNLKVRWYYCKERRGL